MNVILGIVISSYLLLHYEQKYLPNDAVTDGIYAFSLGKEIGLQTGDKIVAINGKPVERFSDLLGEKVVFGCTLTVDREGKLMDVKVPDDFYKRIVKSTKGNFISTNKAVFPIDSPLSGKPAAIAGMIKGDKIIAINGERIISASRLIETIHGNKNKVIVMTLLRNDKDTVSISPVVSDSGTIGIALSNKQDYGDYAYKNYNLETATRYGAKEAVGTVITQIKGFRQIFRGKEKVVDSLQGPIGIAHLYGGVWDWRTFWFWTGFLSMILAFVNILPIPALDGGHAIFLLIEAVTRRKFSDKFIERAQIGGMIVLLALMVFATGNDIFKLFK